MDVDDVEVTLAEQLLQPTTTTTTLPSPLDFQLPAATYLFLQRIGIIPSTNSELKGTNSNNSENHATLSAKPLIPAADAILLLSTLPSSLLPTDLPYPVTPASPSPVTRRALLSTLARLALEPSLTVEVMRRYRPLSVLLWGRWLEMLGLDATGEWRKDGEEKEGERIAVEKVFRALVRVLGVHENVFACVPSTWSGCELGLELTIKYTQVPHDSNPPPSSLLPASPSSDLPPHPPRNTSPDSPLPPLLPPLPPNLFAHLRSRLSPLVLPLVDRTNHEVAPAPRNSSPRLAPPS